MDPDIFGDLRDWGRVLEQLADLTRLKKLDDHQAGLTRILRYRDNWRLREAALETVIDLKDPSDELITVILDIMDDDGSYHEVRVLAAEALSMLMTGLRKTRRPGPSCVCRRVIKHMHALLELRPVPVLHRAIDRILPRVEAESQPGQAADE